MVEGVLQGPVLVGTFFIVWLLEVCVAFDVSLCLWLFASSVCSFCPTYSSPLPPLWPPAPLLCLPRLLCLLLPCAAPA